MYTYLSSKEKQQLVQRARSGEHVSKLAKEAGISRTIFYKWLAEYKKTEQFVQKQALLTSRRPAGETHWRHVPGLHAMILEVVMDYPDLSIDKITKEVHQRSGKKIISRYGTYSLLKKLNLSTAENRHIYAQSQTKPLSAKAQQSATKKEIQIPVRKNTFLQAVGQLPITPAVLMLILALVVVDFMKVPIHIAQPFSKHDLSTQMPEDNKTTIPAVRKDSKIKEQNFTWGVLAINTNKSRYEKGDTVKVYFGVLDKLGKTICDANLILKVITPSQKEELLSMRNGTIKSKKTCLSNNGTTSADYDASYQVKELGKYQMELIAETQEGSYAGKRSFEVGDQKAFSIDRYAPSRIYPPTTYPVVFTIQAHRDFSGTIQQQVPADFEILPLITMNSSPQIQRVGESNVLSWGKSFKKGEQITIGYQFRAPYTSPQFYTLGALSMRNNSSVFNETSGWEIASDAIALQQFIPVAASASAY